MPSLPLSLNADPNFGLGRTSFIVEGRLMEAADTTILPEFLMVDGDENVILKITIDTAYNYLRIESFYNVSKTSI